MDKQHFRNLFVRALKEAAQVTDIRLHKRIPRSFLIEFHGPAGDDNLISVSEAVDKLYLGENRFYRIIDIAIRKLTAENTVAIVCVSGHQPGAFSETWDPTSLGPFKQLLSQNIEDETAQV